MTTTDTWVSPVSGDWDDPENWSSGVPDGTDADVQIDDAHGVTITLATAHTVDDLSITGDPGTIFSESATGSLNIQSGFNVSDGATVILAGANINQNFATATISDSRLDLRNNAALGTLSVVMHNSVLTCRGDITVENAFDILHEGHPVTFSAAHGSNLTFAGSLNFGDQGAVILGETGSNGTVTLAPIGLHYTGAGAGQAMTIAAGVVRIGNDTGASMFSASGGGAPATSVASGATFDLNGFAVDMYDLEANISFPIQISDGRITNSGAFANLTVGKGSFGGAIDGKINLIVDGPFDLYANPTLKGSITVSGGTLDLFATGAVHAPIIFDHGILEFRGPYLGATGVETLNGAISGSGLIRQESSSQLLLSHANSFSGVFETDSGVTTIENIAALGTAQLRFVGGAIVSTVSGAMSNVISLQGAGTLAAVHGRTLVLAGAISATSTGASLTFGVNGDDGVIVTDLSGSGFRAAIAVAAGTLRFGEDSSVFSADTSTNVARGATLDLDGHAVTIGGLDGAGAVVNSAAGLANLKLAYASFGGVIGGNVAVEVAGTATLTNANTYSGSTTVDAGAILSLGNGGSGGSVAGPIDDEGRLVIDRSDAVTVSGVISGAGSLVQRGGGTTTLSGVNSFSGGVVIKAGELLATDGGALGDSDVIVQGGVLAVETGSQLGSGHVTLAGGELLALNSLTLDYSFNFQGISTTAAAHGATLTMSGDFHVTDNAAVLHFGGGGNDGAVVLAPSSIEQDHNGYTIDIDAGTVRQGTGLATALIGQSGLVNVAAGATFDIGGQPTLANNLSGAGRITDTGSPGLLVVDDAVFSGAIDGALTVVVEETAAFSGAGSFTDLQIGAGGSVTLASTAAEKVTFQGGGALVLTPSAKLTGAIEGFGSGVTIDVEAIGYAKTDKLTYAPNIGKLVISDGSHSVTLHFGGSHAKADFALSDDGQGGVLIGFKAAAGAAHGIETAAAEDLQEHHHHQVHGDYGLAV